MKKLIVVILSLVSFIISANTETTFSSFGTLGFTLSDSEQYGYRRNINYDEAVYRDDFDLLSRSLLGLQMNSTINSNIDFTVQLVLRDVSKESLNNYLSLAFLRYSPSAQWSIRIGRTTPDIFLITEFRNVTFAYNWAAVPIEVYGMVPYEYTDGVDIDYITRLFGGTLTNKLYTGVSETTIPIGSLNETYRIKDIIGLSTKYEKGDWTFQARHSRVRSGNEGDSTQLLIDAIKQIPSVLWPNAVQFSERLKTKGTKFKFTSFGLQTHFEPFVFSAEISQARSSALAVPTITNGYGSLAYQQNQHTYFILGAFVEADNFKFAPVENMQFFPELISAIEQFTNFYAFNQRSLSLGWRWDLDHNIASTLQVTRTNLDENGGTLWINKKSNASEEKINSLFFNISWAF